jgi:hypothetical protein
VAQVAPEPVHVTTSLFDEAPVASPPAPVVVRSQPARPAPVPVPPIALTLPPDSGLELVETRFAPAPSDELAETPRPKRVRPPKVEIASEPLEIVETVKGVSPPAT